MNAGLIVLIMVIILILAACLVSVIAERNSSACPKAKYRGKLLGHDTHKFVPVLARKHMERSTTYIVSYKCQL